ncbi:MAG: hypothetical protein K9N35_04800 [Candidatus Marinimicrobia bacterium]|nr:hypothetical protein [Candidatus Neomarinimicrobiota bacterium]
MADFAEFDSVKNSEYTMVTLHKDRPVLLKHFRADRVLENYTENEYDEYGNHISQRSFDKAGQKREEMLFKNDPEELALFRTVFGPTFIPANSNFSIRREYNDSGRETGYFILGVDGRNIYSRITTYREDGRKEKEILKDHLNGTLLAERRYKYIDQEKRTVLEEFDGMGKMVQRVVLFDQHDIIEE